MVDAITFRFLSCLIVCVSVKFNTAARSLTVKCLVSATAATREHEAGVRGPDHGHQHTQIVHPGYQEGIHEYL